jgi:hypothetical protein
VVPRTAWDNTAEVLTEKFVSPPYCAVSECVPAVSAEVASVAAPLLFSDPVPSAVVPSKNVTVPVGVPVPGAIAVKVAVSVTIPPATEGFTSAVSAVAVEACITAKG